MSSATALKLWFMTLLWLGILQSLTAQDSKEPRHPPSHPVTRKNETGDLICTPFGACEPCPVDALNQPFCRPFGNRRLVHCVNTTDAQTNSPNSGRHAEPSVPPPKQSTGEVLAWESCGRIVPKERADFYEFVACNVAFAVVSLGVLFFRSKRMQVQQARQLAARIGLFREDRRGRV